MAERVFSIAPMMGLTTRHGRFLLRLLTRRAFLYTDMIPARAFLRSPHEVLPWEGATGLQLAGDTPEVLAEAAGMARGLGYAEINLNAGCPSIRAAKGGFGAVWMRDPVLAGECVAAVVAQSGGLPVSVKCRLGIDDQSAQDSLFAFAEACRTNGASTLIVHARKAWLKGISPAANRTRPPLDYDLVRALKQAMPEMEIILNGGIKTLAEAKHLAASGVDGVMIGRAAFHQPMVLAEADRLFFGASPQPPPQQAFILQQFADYLEGEQKGRNTPLSIILRPWMQLFHGQQGARTWRRFVGEVLARSSNPVSALRQFAAQSHFEAA